MSAVSWHRRRINQHAVGPGGEAKRVARADGHRRAAKQRAAVVAAAVRAPNTLLLKQVIDSALGSAAFHFKATGKASGFRCALIRTPTRKGAKRPAPKYTACHASKTFTHLRSGRYELFVRAVGPGGADASPLTFRFTIRRTTRR